MSTVKLHDKEFQTLISNDAILARIKELAEDIKKTKFEKTPLLIAVLNGSFRFVADLVQQIEFPVQVEFVKLESYRRMKSSGKVNLYSNFGFDVRDQEVIIIEDIVDTGNTLDFLVPLLKADEPSSLRIATLLHKPNSYLADFKLDFVGFEIEDEFVVGYGLDYEDLGRELNDIYQLRN